MSEPPATPSDRRTETPGGRRAFDENQDALRRTRLANERTYLAWWRTGLTALAVSLAAGKVVPTLAHTSSRWPYAGLGAGYAVLGVMCIAYGFRREQDIARAISEGRFMPMDKRYSALLTTLGVALGVVTLLLILIEQ
jgi:inner membrane protein YidH